MSDLVLLVTFPSRAEALIAQGFLEAHGIDAFAPDAHILGAEVDPSWMSGWRLLVDEDVLERAKAVLRDAEAAHADD